MVVFLGSQYDKYGNLVDWWGNQSARQFSDLAQCFVDEYNQFVIYGHHVQYHVCLLRQHSFMQKSL